MAFKNLADLFNQRMNQLYGAYSTGDSVEYKPNDPNREETLNDNRVAPIGSVERDVIRIGSYLKSGQGIRFLLEQALLQTGNTWAETRIFNPLEFIGNVVPYLHIKRPLRDARDEIISDPSMSPASRGIGKAGRLQKETKASAQARIVMAPNARNIFLSLLSQSGLAGTLSGVVQAFGDSSLGVDDRPELDIQGNFYSVMLWQGNPSAANDALGQIAGALTAAGAALGNIGLPNLLGVVRPPNIIGGLKSLVTSPTGAASVTPVVGMRYFILDANNATRYINDTTILTRLPLILHEDNPSTQSGLSKLTYPDSALENTYTTDSRLNFIASHITSQIVNGNITQATTNFGLRGVVGGLNNGNLPSSPTSTPVTDMIAFQQLVDSLDQRQVGINDTTQRTGYYHDLTNEFGVISGSQGVLPGTYPEDYIQFTFYDVVNDALIPFRAILSDMSETVTPTFSETKYIGRIERNIVYQGVIRNLSFTMNAVAFSPSELEVMWKKVNYLTGLTFPAKYTSDGFMVPGLTKLTIGNYYKDQPGYISQLTHTIDPDISWETEVGSQVPHMIQIQVQYQVIEKTKIIVSSPIYGFGVSTT